MLARTDPTDQTDPTILDLNRFDTVDLTGLTRRLEGPTKPFDPTDPPEIEMAKFELSRLNRGFIRFHLIRFGQKVMSKAFNLPTVSQPGI